MNRDSNKGNPLYVMGQELILEFTEEVSETIKNYLHSKWGYEWENECLISDRDNPIINLKDFSYIARQLLELNNQHFRLAIAQVYFNRLTLDKPHLLSFEMIRKSRNLWAHPDRVIVMKDLNYLAFNISSVLPNDNSLSIKCKKVLGLKESGNYANKVANLTSISEMYSHSIEYKSEFASALKGFASISNELSKNIESKKAFDTVYHTLLSTAANFMMLQPLYYQLLLDQIIKYSDPRTGRKIQDEILEKFNREIDTENSLKFTSVFIDDIQTDASIKNCECELCKITGKNLIADLREKSHQELDEYYFRRFAEKKDNELLVSDLGPLPPLVIFIMAVLVGKLDLDAHDVYTNWSFDVLNLDIPFSDSIYENEEVLNSAMKLIAVRNGVDPDKVNKINFFDDF